MLDLRAIYIERWHADEIKTNVNFVFHFHNVLITCCGLINVYNKYNRDTKIFHSISMMLCEQK